jgi:hypothetical protein
MFKLIVSTLALSFPVVSFADQCAVVDTDLAKSFVKFVKKGSYLGQLCEPCGELPSDSEGGGPNFSEVKSIAIKAWPGSKGQQSTILLNGKTIDLAYTYVTTAVTQHSSVAVNAAFLVGCPADGVTNRFIIGD